MNDADRTLLRELRTALLHLHKTLLDWQRAEFEQDRGPMPATQLLQFIFNDEAFAWLRPMSGLIVAIDEALAAKPPESPAMAPCSRRHASWRRRWPAAPIQSATRPHSRSCPKRCSRTAISSLC